MRGHVDSYFLKDCSEMAPNFFMLKNFFVRVYTVICVGDVCDCLLI